MVKINVMELGSLKYFVGKMNMDKIQIQSTVKCFR